MLAVLADATDDETLRDAGMMRAKGLIATLQSDADNLFVILSAKALNPSLTDFGAHRERTERKENAAGRRRLRIRALRHDRQSHGASNDPKPHVYQFIDFTTKGIGLDVGHRAGARPGASRISHRKPSSRLQIRRDLGVIILAIRKSDGQMMFNPPAEAEIQVGDYPNRHG